MLREMCSIYSKTLHSIFRMATCPLHVSQEVRAKRVSSPPQAVAEAARGLGAAATFSFLHFPCFVFLPLPQSQRFITCRSWHTNFCRRIVTSGVTSELFRMATF